MGGGSRIWATWVSYDRKNSSTCLRWLASFSGEESPNTYPISPAVHEDPRAERFCFQGFIVCDKFGTQSEHAHSYHKCYRNFSPSSCFNTCYIDGLHLLSACCIPGTGLSAVGTSAVFLIVKWTRREIHHIRPFEADSSLVLSLFTTVASITYLQNSFITPNNTQLLFRSLPPITDGETVAETGAVTSPTSHGS